MALTLNGTSGIVGAGIGTIGPSGANITGVGTFTSIVSSTGTITGDLLIDSDIKHIGDTNTAIRFPAADTIATETGGSERLRITSAGKVLIGTTTPQGNANADDLVVSTSGTTGITIRSGTSSNGNLFFADGTSSGAEYAGWVTYDHGNNRLTFGTNASERLVLGSGGDLTLYGGEGLSANLYLNADQSDDNGDSWRIGSNQDVNDLTIANNASGSWVDFVTIDACPTMGTNVGVATASGAFCGTVNKAYKYTQPSPGNQNIPYDTWSTISTSYGWALPSAGTYKLTSGNRVRLWEVAGYIQTRLYDNTASNAIADTLRMMFEQGNNSAPMGRYNTQINLVWVVSVPTARTIYQQYNTNNNSTYSSIQDDVNGRNYYLWERIG